MSEATKEYNNGEITVVWDSTKCIHSANCVKNLSSVFNPRARPWIKIDAASSEEIVAAVGHCPSGALSIKQESVSETGETDPATEINCLENGPLMIVGDFKIMDREGKLIETKEKAFLCRCGTSENKPFCDGKHKKAGFLA